MTVDSADAAAYQPYRSIARYWLPIVVLVIIGAVLVAGVSAARSAAYTSTATVAWNPNFRASLPALTGAPDGNIQPTIDVATAAVSVRGDTVMTSAGKALGLSADDLRDDTSATSSLLNDTIKITVSAPSADAASKRTDAVAKSFIDESRSQVLAVLQAQAAEAAQAIQSTANVLTPSDTADLRSNQALLAAAAANAAGPASIIENGSKPVDARGTTTRNAAIGAVLGLILGVLVALALGARARRRRAHAVAT